jgi:hypothetical protein
LILPKYLVSVTETTSPNIKIFTTV